jgi:hypothetical protein
MSNKFCMLEVLCVVYANVDYTQTEVTNLIISISIIHTKVFHLKGSYQYWYYHL